MLTSQFGRREKVSSKPSISDLAVQFISGIQKSLPTFERRNAVVYKLVANHRLKPVIMKEWTICSQCQERIWFTGHQCGHCQLMNHTRCMQSIRASCVKVTGEDSHSHRFKSKYFSSPTNCHHCGTLLYGVISHQGVECELCKLSVHFNCQKLVCLECKPRDTGVELTSNKSNAIVYNHESKMSIQDFDLIRLIGTGSFSKVYLAKLKGDRQQVNKKRFAIKVIKKTNAIISGDPESALTEMQTLSLGRQYPFLTIAHCCFHSNERLFIVMEHVVGRDLLYHIRKSRKFTEDRAKFYAAEIFLALDFLHTNGIIYRDLKLDNIILDNWGHCQLLDFGMSKKLTNSTNGTRTFCGTPSYIAPEIIREQCYDYSVDWWSLGVLMYEMIVGCSPFEAQNEDEIYRLILTETVHFPRTLSYQARSVLEGLLEKDPKHRLGCQILEGSSLAIREHPFFMFSSEDLTETHRWNDVEARRITPPYVPTSLDLEDDDDDDDENEIGSVSQLNLSPINKDDLKIASHNDFDGFSFYSESFKSIAGLKF